MADELNPQETGGDMYRKEVKRALNEDETRLGEVWRLREMSKEEIAKELNVKTTGFVYNYRSRIEAIVKDIVPRSPSVAQHYARALQGFAKRHQQSLSPSTYLELWKRADECNSRANDPVRLEEEEQKLALQTNAAKKKAVPGIYVYALPHYLRHPVVKTSEDDETDDRTYLKVGMSEKDAIKRFQEQRSSTMLPEKPRLLRIYVGSNGIDIAEVEKKIHSHLEAAEYFRNSERGAGTEWFLTHLKFLDSTTELLGLKIHFAFENSDDD